jgi:hypothetical protein
MGLSNHVQLKLSWPAVSSAAAICAHAKCYALSYVSAFSFAYITHHWQQRAALASFMYVCWFVRSVLGPRGSLLQHIWSSV